MKKRHVVKNLVLDEVSGVTRPAQSHALVHMWKSEDMPLIDEITKYLSTDDGAKSFTSFIESNTAEQRKWVKREKLWPLINALKDSVTSIVIDDTIDERHRQEKVRESVAQFVAASQHPEIYDINKNELLELFKEENDNMSEELVKKAEGLEAQVAELTKSLGEAVVLAKMSDKEKEYLASLNDEAKADEFRAASSADRAKLMRKSAEGDEVFKSADGHEIRKSVVGDGVFAILKSQEDRIKAARDEMVKSAERAQTVEFTKRAEDEFANLPGDTVTKVAVLKGMASMDEATRTELEKMLKAGSEALAKGFGNFGVPGGSPSDITKATKLASEVKKLMDADSNLTKAQAEVKAISANPALYEG